MLKRKQMETSKRKRVCCSVHSHLRKDLKMNSNILMRNMFGQLPMFVNSALCYIATAYSGITQVCQWWLLTENKYLILLSHPTSFIKQVLSYKYPKEWRFFKSPPDVFLTNSYCQVNDILGGTSPFFFLSVFVKTLHISAQNI